MALDHFLNLGGWRRNGADTQQWALSIYGLYRVHNARRHGHIDISEVEDAFKQYVREGRRGTEQPEPD